MSNPNKRPNDNKDCEKTIKKIKTNQLNVKNQELSDIISSFIFRGKITLKSVLRKCNKNNTKDTSVFYFDLTDCSGTIRATVYDQLADNIFETIKVCLL